MAVTPHINKTQDKIIVKDSPLFVNTIGARYVIAVLSAWVAEAVTYPIDLTKTRLQIQSEVAAAKHGNKLEHLTMTKTIISVAKNEGILKLWSGLMPMFQRHAIYAGSRLVIYEKIRNVFKDDSGNVSLALASIGGISAGCIAQLLASPTDLVKVQMQAEGRNVLQGKKPRFKNCREVYKVLYRETGILGFWRGAIPNVQRAALVNLGDLGAYDYAKHFLMRQFGLSDGPIAHGGAAFIAGLVAALLGTPADVLKTRLMNQPMSPDGKPLLYKGMIECFRVSVKNEGFFALYKGFIPMWMRLGPWALINWVAFENIMIALGGHTF